MVTESYARNSKQARTAPQVLSDMCKHYEIPVECTSTCIIKM